MREAGGIPVAVETPLMKPESFGAQFEPNHADALLCDLHHNVFAQIQLFSPDIVLSTAPRGAWGLLRILSKIHHVNRISANVKPVGYYLVNLLHLLPRQFQKQMNRILSWAHPGMLHAGEDRTYVLRDQWKVHVPRPRRMYRRFQMRDMLC